MIREILFRGKRTLNRGWAEGYYVKFYGNGCCNPTHMIFEIYEEKKASQPCEVEPETVCQYTGLIDKNGRKIFEGDIVNCREKRGAAFWHCKVVWNQVKARFDVVAMDCAFPMCLDNVGDDISINSLDYEVISNIFNNPSLLEGGV